MEFWILKNALVLAKKNIVKKIANQQKKWLIFLKFAGLTAFSVRSILNLKP